MEAEDVEIHPLVQLLKKTIMCHLLQLKLQNLTKNQDQSHLDILVGQGLAQGQDQLNLVASLALFLHHPLHRFTVEDLLHQGQDQGHLHQDLPHLGQENQGQGHHLLVLLWMSLAGGREERERCQSI